MPEKIDFENFSELDKPGLLLIPGRFQPDTTFSLLENELSGGAYAAEPYDLMMKPTGIETITPNLPTDQPGISYEDCAAQAIWAVQLRRFKKIWVGSHSGGGDIAATVVNTLLEEPDEYGIEVEGMISIASNFSPAVIGRPQEWEKDIVPKKNLGDYDNAIVEDESGLTFINPDDAREILFADCPPEVVNSETSRLRAHIPRRTKPISKQWLTVPHRYIVCANDLVTNPEYQRYIAKNWLGDEEPLEIDSGHFPQWQAPKLLGMTVFAAILEKTLSDDVEEYSLRDLSGITVER